MTPQDQARIGSISITLRDGRPAVIRPLRTSDAPALAAFYAAVPREDFRFYCPHALDEANARRVAAAAESPHEVVLLLEAGTGEIAGYAWFRWSGDDAPSSTFGLCIRRGWQDCGAGRALIERINHVARTLGPPVMSLTVQEANPRAVALYQKMGFRIVRQGMRAPRLGFEPEPEFAMERRTRE